MQELPDHLAVMSLFVINTGCRDREICQLRWEWEVSVPDMPGVFVFIVPGQFIKNREDRLIVLNRVARSVIERMRGQHPEYVFSYKGKPFYRMLTSAWKRARVRMNLHHLRVHDLRHTFGRRLRAAGVSFEDRQDLLGHKSGRMTTHYSNAELQNLIAAANKICDGSNSGTTLTTLKLVSQQPTSNKFPIANSQ